MKEFGFSEQYLNYQSMEQAQDTKRTGLPWLKQS
jgi:hypothetical protein